MLTLRSRKLAQPNITEVVRLPERVEWAGLLDNSANATPSPSARFLKESRRHTLIGKAGETPAVNA